METYVNKETGEKVKAILFDSNNLDKFYDSVVNELKEIVFDFKAESHTAELFYGFGNRFREIVHSGDYVLQGDEIPRTIPTIHYFDVMNGQEFLRKFKPDNDKE